MEFFYGETVGQSQNLVSQADTHGGDFLIFQSTDGFDGCGIVFRIAGACRRQWAVSCSGVSRAVGRGQSLG